MSETTMPQAWPTDWRQALVLLLVVLALLFHFRRSASDRLTVTVGAIRLHPPTLVPLTDAETTMAVGLLGGAIEDYLAQFDQGPIP
ncbi:MAG: hypothetical protein ACLQBX_01110 [Candidatus Limnocylindrales bacterium]